MYDERLLDILPVAICVTRQSDVDMIGDIFERQNIRWIDGSGFSDFSPYKPGSQLVYFIGAGVFDIFEYDDLRGEGKVA